MDALRLITHFEAGKVQLNLLFMSNYFLHVENFPFLTRELRACARASYRYDVGNGIRSLARSLDWSIPVNFF